MGTQYKIIIKLQSWNTGTQQTLTPSWSCHGTDANGDPITISRNVPTADLYPAIAAPVAPVDNYVVTTGDQRNTIYYTVPANAAFGFYVYSSLSPGAENYNLPISPAVDPPGGGQTGTMSFADTGEPNGVNRYYTVKLTYINSVTGQLTMSSPSAEDFDAPDPTGIPWDSGNVSAVLSAIRADYAADPDNPTIGTLRVSGPDGKIFQDGNGSVQPADGSYDPSSNSITLASGENIPAPPITDPSTVSPPPITTPVGLEFDGKIGDHGGIYRRVRTVLDAEGVSGQYTVPVASNVSSDSRDGVFIYIGHSGASEVDAGLMWSAAFKTWEPYIHGRGPQLGVGGYQFKPNEVLTLKYYPRSRRASLSRHGSISLLLVNGLDSSTGHSVDRAVGVTTQVVPGELVRAKRLCSIAQGHLLQNELFESRQSYILNLAWHNGSVLDSSGTWVPWDELNILTGNPLTNENGAFLYPTGNHVVFNQTSPFTDETSISLDPRWNYNDSCSPSPYIHGSHWESGPWITASCRVRDGRSGR